MTSSQVPEPIDERNLPRSYDDVRQWLDLVESMGELKRIDGADWDLEIGTMSRRSFLRWIRRNLSSCRSTPRSQPTQSTLRIFAERLV